jgi:manganese/zinc-transporting P-type ATPase C
MLRCVHRMPGRIRWIYRCRGGSPHDSRLIVAQLQLLHGVTAVRVNVAAASLIVQYDPALVDEAELERQLLAVEAPDAGVAPLVRAEAAAAPLTSGRIVVSTAVTLGACLLPPQLGLLVSLLSAAPVLWRGAASLFSAGLTSSSLEAVAVAVSLAQRDLFAANVTSLMIELGHGLQETIARRSDASLRGMLKPVSDAVWVERGGREIEVASGEVRVGDTVVVGTGAVVPVDGTILRGTALINESALTGESFPRRRERGDRVMSGTHLQDGRIWLYAEQVGGKTAAARMATYVEQALQAKSDAQLQAAQLADRLVAPVVGLAGASLLLSGDPTRVAAVVQADFSCALKLSTPVTFKAAMFRAGQHGMLIKGAHALEKLAEADTFVFDKTGTLTDGSLALVDVTVFDKQFSREDLITLAASVEEHTVHPLASAVVAAARDLKTHHFAHTDVEFIVAHGVASEMAGQRVVVGSRHFLEVHEGISTAASAREIARLARAGTIPLFVGYGGRLLGILGLRDTVRPDARQTLERLRASGVRRVVMLTGDYRQRADALGRALGVDDVHAELQPEDKVALIDDLSRGGAKIAYVGDGLNDAPALARADVGIAMKYGADLARITADVVLLDDDLSRVAAVKELALSTVQRVHTNYRVAIGMNSGVLAGAVLGLLSPALASVMHNGSTIALLLLALRGTSPAAPLTQLV